MGIFLKFNKKLVSRIRELREKQNLPQQKLAKLVGVSRQTIYYLEKGTYNPSLTISFKISEIFNEPIEDIFYFEPVIKDFMGNKTLDELDEIAEIAGINIEKIMNLRKINDDQLSKMYTEEELIKIANAFGVKFQDVFVKNITNNI